jgi:hypothetical protein
MTGGYCICPDCGARFLEGANKVYLDLRLCLGCKRTKDLRTERVRLSKMLNIGNVKNRISPKRMAQIQIQLNLVRAELAEMMIFDPKT